MNKLLKKIWWLNIVLNIFLGLIWVNLFGLNNYFVFSALYMIIWALNIILLTYTVTFINNNPFTNLNLIVSFLIGFAGISQAIGFFISYHSYFVSIVLFIIIEIFSGYRAIFRKVS